ncbi:MAG: hypothetical protein HXX14_15505 [Bacteroidetes bacterium]|nr:hypothetical protein [Bacteroidota bacterium]
MNTDKTVGKEYQIPELVDLNNINEVLASTYCSSGSSPLSACATGGLYV